MQKYFARIGGFISFVAAALIYHYVPEFLRSVLYERIIVMLGLEELGKTAADFLISNGIPIALVAVGLYLFVSTGKMPFPTTTSEKPVELEYLSSKDVDLGSAIRRVAHSSAWGRWFAAQHLATSKVPIGERYLLDTAASVMRYEILDGAITVRGRLPGQLTYEIIERTDWQSSAFLFLPHPMSLWRLEIIPTGGASIEADGKIKASHKPSEKRNAVIRKYDSLLVDAHEVETVWPRNDAATDKARKVFLKQAKKQGLDKQAIKSLS